MPRTWRHVPILLLLALAACEGDQPKPDQGVDRGIQLLDQGPDAEEAPDLGTTDAGEVPDTGSGGDIYIPTADAGPLEALSLNSTIPNRGPATGNTEVRIIGTGFKLGMSVMFDGVPCEGLSIESENHARCITPSNRFGAGAVDVVLRFDANGTVESDTLPAGFTYFNEVTLTGLQPPRAPTRGGIPLLLEGTGLIESSRIEIRGVPADIQTVNEDGTLVVIVPPGDTGPADVTVANFNGSAELLGGLFYYESLKVDRLEPPIGPSAGGNIAVLHGSGLTADSRVMIGAGGAEVQMAADDRTQLTLLIPRGNAPGAVDVTITNDNGEITVEEGYLYFDEAVAGFGVVGIAPNSGPIEGDNLVFIAGSGFTAATEVRAGVREVPCELIDANQLRCTMPPGAAVGIVPIQVSEGAELAEVDYTYFQTLELIAVLPGRGSIAGGTTVTLAGAGFVPDMEIQFGDQTLLNVQVIDETTLTGTTPANTAGAVDVEITTPFSRSRIPAGYEYFDPTTRFGGVWGDPIDNAVNITVLHAIGGAPLDEVVVILVCNDGDLRLDGITDATGLITLSAPQIEPPCRVTAAKEGFEVTTFEDVTTENVTIYLQPNDGMGDPPPGVPAAVLRGLASGLDLLPKPINERYINVMVIETSHSSPYNRNRLPPPGPGGMLTEDGQFEIIARPGELALIATAGELDRDALKQYQDGEIDYWTMRQSLNPLKMGLRRFISASPGQEINGLNVELDHPTTNQIPIDLDNPPLGPDPGPMFYGVLPRLNLGAEGYWEMDSQAIALEPSVVLQSMPLLEGWDRDIRFYFIGLAFSGTDNNAPMAITIEETRDVDAGVLITPFVGTPFFINPNRADGGELGINRVVTWGVHDGFDGPIRVPHANLILVEEPGLGPPKPLWRYVTPSLVTEFQMPSLPPESGTAGLSGGVMLLTVLPFIIDGVFDFDQFTYDDLNQGRWKAWSTNTTTFIP